MEENKRLAYAIFLSILAVFIYTQLFAPLPTPKEGARQEQAVQQLPEAQSPGAQNIQKIETSSSNGFAEAAVNEFAKENVSAPVLKDYEESKRVRIENKLFKAEVSFLGGRLLALYLKNHTQSLKNNDAINMVKTKGAAFPLGVNVSGLNDAGVTYTVSGMTAGVSPEQGRYVVPQDGEFSFKLSGKLPNGNGIEKVFRFYDAKYNFDVHVALESSSPDGSPLTLEWIEHHPIEEAAKRYNPLMIEELNQENSVDRNVLPGVQEPIKRSAVKWIGIGDNYFASFLIPSVQAGLNASTKRQGDFIVINALGTPSKGEFIVFTGAKEHDILAETGLGFERSIDLGWFAFIGQPILAGIKFLHLLLGNYGLAIVLFTILLKAALLPFTKTSFVSMKKMQDLQPEMQALKERVKDQAQLQQEMMALYKKHQVNPLGGCLPMLAQVPIFLGMYNALRTSIDLRHTPFALWINDLAAPERLVIMGIPVPVMIILMGASMFLQQFTTPSNMDPQQRKIMLIMPVVFTIMFIIFPFPAGLVLYWLVNNVISITQQVALRTERKITPFQATTVAGVAVFGFAFILTLL